VTRKRLRSRSGKNAASRTRYIAMCVPGRGVEDPASWFVFDLSSRRSVRPAGDSEEAERIAAAMNKRSAHSP
jgi:hypothetical protein